MKSKHQGTRFLPRMAVVGLAGFTGLAACQKEDGGANPTPQGPIDPKVMTESAADSTGDILNATALAADGIGSIDRAADRLAKGLGTVGGSLGGVAGMGDGSGGPQPLIRRRPSALRHMMMAIPGARAAVQPLATESLLGPGSPLGALNATVEMKTELASDLDDTGQALRRLMKERIFTQQNLESKTDSEAIYRLNPDPTCRDLDTNELDGSCVEDLTKVELRVRVSRDGAATSFEILVGSERARPVRLVVDASRLALELYLAEVKRTSAILASKLGQADDTPDVLKGAVRFALTKEAAKKVSFGSAIFEAVEIEEMADAKKSPGKLKSAVTETLWKLTVDGEAGTLSGQVGLGATDVWTSWTAGNVTMPKNLDLHVGTAGLTGQITFTEATEDVKLAGLGFGPGPLVVDVRGQRIFQLDVNASSGRAFDVGITFDSAGMPRFAFTPKFDLSAAFKLMAVASDFKEPPPAHLLDETYRLLIDAPMPVVTPWDGMGDEGGLKVVSGNLSVSSSKVATPVSVPAGQCLVGDAVTDGEHPVLGALKASSCP